VSKRTIAPLFVLICCLAAVASAANPPKVIFIGDTGGWAPIFAAHPNWINKGTDPLNDPGGGYYGPSDSIAYSVLQRFQTDVVAQHPDIVHIVCCWSDAYRDRDAINFLWYSQYNEAMLDMIKAAKAANIKVILGTEPEGTNEVRQENAWIEGYGAANGIPVINYHHLFLEREDFGIAGNSTGEPGLFNAAPPDPDGPGGAAGGPNDTGYAMISVMAENVIETMGLTLKSGYLTSQNQDAYSTQINQNPNSFGPLNVVKFIPFGVYSDGKTRPILNANFSGANGIWTSTDPSVMNVDQTGYGNPVGSGKARIWFQTFTGQTFSPFDVTVGLVCPNSIYCPY
jgi:hypothetical protein